jgi:uncharacterized protein YaiE (UPF0345 family)
MSTTPSFTNVNLNPKANVYFDGRCISHSFTASDGSQKSAGVVLPSSLTFNTAAPEIMECVAGSCNYRLKGEEQWSTATQGVSFHIPKNSSFDIEVKDAFHYICHYA